MLLNLKNSEIIRPFLILFIIIIILTIMIATDFVKIEKYDFVFPLSAIRVSTVITAIASFGIVLFLQRRNTLKSIYFASLTVIFSLGLYEIVWWYTGVGLRGFDLRIFPFAALFGWVFLGIREVFRKPVPKFSILLYGVFAVSMVIWIGIGFPFNYLGDPSFSISGEILNVVSKAALFIAYALHIGSVKS